MTSAYFSLILRRYGGTADHRSALLECTGVHERMLVPTSAEITLGQQLRQIRNANRALSPGWSLSIKQKWHLKKILHSQEEPGFVRLKIPMPSG